VDIDLYLQVKEILEINKKERHLRGGEATRIKYANIEQKL
jgi:putative DeoR family transcriptional regulator (stage III sporulation protein D)